MVEGGHRLLDGEYMGIGAVIFYKAIVRKSLYTLLASLCHGYCCS